MFSLPKKIVCAIEAVLYIACDGSGGAVSSKEIADVQNLPPRYLEQLMQRLVHAGILRGVRGPRGGYVLARERRRITVADICLALREEEEGEPALAATQLAAGVILPVMERVRGGLVEELRGVTLADLRDQALLLALAKRQDNADFAI